ncbi:hypothetical protein ACIPW5_17090 [Streptomyces sp. NPDC090077]|uniref:hypothetical protein n=1 Tax=Streptomyces sp. NPDC090077 TaxID=3365938 RepID=UPI00382C07F3
MRRLRAAAGLVLLLGLTLVLAGRVPATPDRAPHLRAAAAPAGPVRATADRGPAPEAAPARAGTPDRDTGPGADAGGAAPEAASVAVGPVPGTPDRGSGPGAVAGSVRGPAVDPGGPARGAAAAAGPARGPSCDPGGPGPGRGAGVLPRGGAQEHAQLAAAVRQAPERACPYAAYRAGTPVRGPDLPAPKPVELSVMRV